MHLRFIMKTVQVKNLVGRMAEYIVINTFKKNLMDIGTAETNPDRVLQINEGDRGQGGENPDIVKEVLGLDQQAQADGEDQDQGLGKEVADTAMKKGGLDPLGKIEEKGQGQEEEGIGIETEKEGIGIEAGKEGTVPVPVRGGATEIGIGGSPNMNKIRSRG